MLYYEDDFLVHLHSTAYHDLFDLYYYHKSKNKILGDLSKLVLCKSVPGHNYFNDYSIMGIGQNKWYILTSPPHPHHYSYPYQNRLPPPERKIKKRHVNVCCQFARISAKNRE